MTVPAEQRAALERVLGGLEAATVAVSGGVDSLTLAVLAGRRLGRRARMLHAASPAVPPEATARVRRLAAAEGWDLAVVDAGEFADPDYLANPVNRCLFCKRNLYATIAGLTDGGTILSGANLDDLGDYRPGLDAAAECGVRHPYVEAGLDKAAVRALARDLGLGDLAALPAAPCLSSRLETGIAVEAGLLALVHRIERAAGDWLDAAEGPARPGRAVRCRVRRDGLVLELDPGSLAALSAPAAAELRDALAALAAAAGRPAPRLAPYRRGSAFLRGAAAAAGS